MPHLQEKHALAIRWLHWVNFPLLALMIWSGVLIYWANDVYRIGWGETTLLHLFPDWVYERLPVARRLAEGMVLHFVFMWLFVSNGVAYVVYLLVSGEWKHVAPERDSFKNALAVVLHDLHLRKELPPQGKYNGAQKLAYSGVILMAFGSTITGLAIYKPAQLSWLASLLCGYQMARWEHFWLMAGFVVFFVIHIMQVIRAGWGNFRSMIAGCDLVQDIRETESHS